MSIITKREFPKIRKNNLNKLIVYCDGSFDITHAGHVLFFEECKSMGQVLVVGVGADSDVRKYKGKTRPILNQSIRLKMVSALKPVDYCFLNKLPIQKEYLSHLEVNFRKLQPNIYVVNEDALNIEYRKKVADKHNVKIVVARRTCPPDFEAISTTKIIEKVKNS